MLRSKSGIFFKHSQELVMDDEDSSQLFHEAMKGTLPLRQKKHQKTTIKKPNNLLPENTLQNRREAAQNDPRDYNLIPPTKEVTPLDPEQTLAYAHSSISRKQISRLKNLEFQVEDTLDLHGKTIEQACQSTHIYLEQCYQKNMRCICIIHGKAHNSQDRTNTLKSQINSWLRQTNVLAFCSAPNQYGGTGAVLVLLKRNRNLH